LLQFQPRFSYCLLFLYTFLNPAFDCVFFFLICVRFYWSESWGYQELILVVFEHRFWRERESVELSRPFCVDGRRNRKLGFFWFVSTICFIFLVKIVNMSKNKNKIKYLIMWEKKIWRSLASRSCGVMIFGEEILLTHGVTLFFESSVTLISYDSSFLFF